MYLFSSSISCLWCCFVLGQSSGLLPQLSYCSIVSQLSSIVALGKVLSVDHERWSVCSTLVGPHLAHWCELPSKERNWHMGESSTQGSWDDGLEHLSCEKGWGLWLFNLRSLRGISSISINKIYAPWREGAKMDPDPFQWGHVRTRGNGHKQENQKFHLNNRKHFFTVRLTENWHRFAEEVAELPSSGSIRSLLNAIFGSLF